MKPPISRTPLAVVLGVAAVLATAMGQWATLPMAIATFAYATMVGGVFLRRNRNRHVPLMLTAIGMDLLLVAVLQVQRNAIQTAVSFTLTPLQQSHVGFSTLATVLYFPTLFFGYQRFRFPTKNPRYRTWHLRCAKAAFVCRTIGFILMFSLLGRPQ